MPLKVLRKIDIKNTVRKLGRYFFIINAVKPADVYKRPILYEYDNFVSYLFQMEKLCEKRERAS